MERIINYIKRMNVPVWHFWNPSSGPIGGLIGGFLFGAVVFVTMYLFK